VKESLSWHLIEDRPEISFDKGGIKGNNGTPFKEVVAKEGAHSEVLPCD
jgi:hypothetical protein